MDGSAISQVLYIALAVLVVVLMTLLIIFVVIVYKEKYKKDNKNETIKSKKTSKDTIPSTTATSGYNKQSIFNFMEFEKIEDNMIIQKKGKKFLMVIECQGVNYDLMSKMEKVSVEEGFQQFLNTLRHPIQIYIQTRKVNLESSIDTYKKKVREIESNYEKMVYEYNNMIQSGVYGAKDLEAAFYELTKQRNLLEYGKDIITNTEKMSLNRNVLNKKYYIVVPYYSEDSANDKLDNEEIKSVAFSELYTKSQAIIRTLTGCSIIGKILSSQELVELLYVAYNREDSEVLGVDKLYQAGYDNLYSTSQDVYEKKIKILDEEVERQAMELANEKLEKAKSRSMKKAEEKESNLEILVSKMAELILEENKDVIGEEVAEEAIKDIQNEEGGTGNEKKKSTRGRKKQTNK